MGISGVSSSLIPASTTTNVRPASPLPVKQQVIQNNPQLEFKPLIKLTLQSQDYLRETSGLSTFDNSPNDVAQRAVNSTVRQTFELNQEFNNPKEEDLLAPASFDDESSNIEEKKETEEKEESQAGETSENGAISRFKAYMEAEALTEKPESQNSLSILA